MGSEEGMEEILSSRTSVLLALIRKTLSKCNRGRQENLILWMGSGIISLSHVVALTAFCLCGCNSLPMNKHLPKLLLVLEDFGRLKSEK